MHLAGVGPAFRRLGLEPVQLAQDIDRDANVVVGETPEAAGIVKQDIGVEDKGLGRSDAARRFFGFSFAPRPVRRIRLERRGFDGGDGEEEVSVLREEGQRRKSLSVHNYEVK